VGMMRFPPLPRFREGKLARGQAFAEMTREDEEMAWGRAPVPTFTEISLRKSRLSRG